MKPNFFLSPTHVGTLLMYILAAVWIRLNVENIHTTLKKLKLDFKLSGKKITEILVLFFFLIIIRSFLLDFFPFRNYVHFLLVSTQFFASLFNYDGYISGDQLIGPTGALAVSKHCLGFLTMYIFAAMVYLTRTKNPKINWIFILSGLAFLVVLNIVRLVLLFIVVQGPDGVNTAMDHHDIYNYIIFAIIFVMWIVWWEVFLGKEKKGKG
jgi:exosortase/archaeosortase family protein